MTNVVNVTSMVITAYVTTVINDEEKHALEVCEMIKLNSPIRRRVLRIGNKYFACHGAHIRNNIFIYMYLYDNKLYHVINEEDVMNIIHGPLIPGLEYWESVVALVYEYLNTRYTRALRRILLRAPGLGNVTGFSDISIVCLNTGSEE